MPRKKPALVGAMQRSYPGLRTANVRLGVSLPDARSISQAMRIGLKMV